METVQLGGSNAGIAQSNTNAYLITNPNQGSMYHWNMSLELGTIECTALDSSEINIIWGNLEGLTDLCVYEEDEFGCFGEESCIEIEIKRANKLRIVGVCFFIFTVLMVLL